MILKVGVTGGIGSGKSIVTKVFSLLGIPVLDADSVAKTIMDEDEILKQKIIQLFGKDAYENKKLNRKFIANIVFNDAEKLESLNALIHPATIAAADKWMQLQTASYAIKEAALIFESSAIASLDYVIGVYAPQELRIKRIMERDKISEAEVMNRINKQIDEAIKMRLCDFVIVNDEQQLIISQIIKIHEELIKFSKSKT